MQLRICGPKQLFLLKHKEWINKPGLSDRSGLKISNCWGYPNPVVS
jgi:hypothetical protein